MHIQLYNIAGKQIHTLLLQVNLLCAQTNKHIEYVWH